MAHFRLPSIGIVLVGDERAYAGGSALDIFGGKGVRYADVVEFNRKLAAEK